MEASLSEQRKSFYSHRANARKRGIEFNLTFEQWWGLWKPFYHRRGSRAGDLMMCRKMDTGAYELGNVTIGTARDNQNTRNVVAFNKVIEERQAAHVGYLSVDEEDDEDGWTPSELKNPYKSCIDCLR